jgi:hypothetical protein
MNNRDGLPNNDNWETPDWLYRELDQEFRFDFDPCPRYPAFDGLTIGWGKSNFINPPYNRVDKPKFIQRAYEEWKKGKTCVLLIPAATDSRQFHELMLPNAEIRFLKGRVAFKGVNTKGIYTEKNKGKHASMVVVFRGCNENERREMTEEFKVTRINHIPEILEKRKMSREDFLHEAGYKTRLSRPTLYKAIGGEVIDYETAEKLAWFFDLKPHQVLESRFD